VGRGGAKAEAKFNPDGSLDAVAGEAGGFGVELDREGKTTFKVPLASVGDPTEEGAGVSLESYVDQKHATTGAALVGQAEGSLFGWTLEVEGKLGFSSKGMDRQYYADIGGQQEGFFGPMPELTDGKQWGELSAERRGWYERQGFSKATWPR
jgi:hypothetical protein